MSGFYVLDDGGFVYGFGIGTFFSFVCRPPHYRVAWFEYSLRYMAIWLILVTVGVAVAEKPISAEDQVHGTRLDLVV